MGLKNTRGWVLHVLAGQGILAGLGLVFIHLSRNQKVDKWNRFRIRILTSNYRMTKDQLPLTDVLNSKWFKETELRISAFCNFIESKISTTGKDYLIELQFHLKRIYEAGANLDWVDLQSNVDFDIQLDDQYYQGFLASLSERIGESRFYWRTFDPTDKADQEVICEDLVDDIGDTYKDLKYSLLVLRLNTVESKENAIWQIKFDFDTHWGDHCMNALYGIHYFLKK